MPRGSRSSQQGLGKSMDCQEFLTLHSEYLDERLSQDEADRCRAHAAACAACNRYDHIIRRGQALLRQLPDPEVSPTFGAVLEYRLSQVRDDAVGARGAGAGAVVALAIAATLAFAAWGPLLRAGDEFERSSELAVESLRASDAPLNAAVMHAPAWFQAPAGAPAFAGTASAARRVDLAFPGPYSPLIIMPPVTQPRHGGAARLTALE